MNAKTDTALRYAWTVEPEIDTAWVHQIGAGGMFRACVYKLDEGYLCRKGKAPGERLAWVITAMDWWHDNLAEGEMEPGCLDFNAAMLAVEAALPAVERRQLVEWLTA